MPIYGRKGGAAALLVRLYLNAKEWIGVDRLADCEKVAQDIVDGVYGAYKVDDRWDAPFDSENDKCDELVFFFSGSCNYTSWHYNQLYNWGVPSNSELFFNDYKVKHGGHNGEFVCSPSYDPTGKLYDFELGMTVQKFRNIPEMCVWRNIRTSEEVNVRECSFSAILNILRTELSVS